VTDERDLDSSAALEAGPPPDGVPDVGQIVRRLRTRRGLNLREVAKGSGLSASFLSALERGESDISLGRLSQLASYFGLDVGSLLGYENVRARPHFIEADERQEIDRGTGVSYQVMHLPGANLELISMEIDPGRGFDDELTHEGVDIVYVLEGEATLVVSGRDYKISAGECVVFSGAYRHTLRNEAAVQLKAISVVTEHIF
jgi:transcriptional regulator with XRE-family HTH domain